jgi:FkbM family methyltransferase
MLPDILNSLRLNPDGSVSAASGYNSVVRGRHGFLCFNRNDIVVGASAWHYGEYFESEVAMFSRFVRPGMHAADVGANIGTHTLALARLVGPSGWVYAFEPQRQVHQVLCANMALNSIPNVDCERLAVSSWGDTINIEELDFSVSGNFGGLALGTSASGKTVQAVSMDAYLAGRPLHFLKADVEGMEKAVVIGMKDTIKKHRTILYLEADKPEQTPALFDHVAALGYDIYWHLPLFYNPDNYARELRNIHSLGFIDTGKEHFDSIGFAINVLCAPKGTDVGPDLLLLEDVREHPLKRIRGRFHPTLGE